MNHIPNKYDVVTDLRRCVLASYSPKAFEDENVKTFLKKAEENLDQVKGNLNESAYQMAKQRIQKAKDPQNLLDKRREDLLTASCLIFQAISKPSSHMNQLIIKTGAQLTPQEIDEINEAKNREWKLPPMTNHQLSISLYFLLKDENGKILAQGQVIKIDPFVFNGEQFRILGIGGIIANIKGQGYGKELMRGVIDFLTKNKISAVGFCGDNIAGFYSKCGFIIVPGLQKRFVYLEENGKKIYNTTEDNVFYFDSQDRFIEKVLKEKDKEVILPRTPDW